MVHRFLGLLLTGLALAQAPPERYVCPMDPDVRSATPAKCPRCGMRLSVRIPDAAEYPVSLETKPAVPLPGKPLKLIFRISHPKTAEIAKLQIIHEKLFHLFVISSDLSFFAHEHPVIQPDGSFEFETQLPNAGEYRLLCDFYPENANPQMIAKTVIVPGEPKPPAALGVDAAPKQSGNLQAKLRVEPAYAIAGQKTMLFFDLSPSEGLEPYLGAWGHMMVSSADTIDLIHAHPAWEQGGPTVQFNIIFPRPGLHRVWVQFQREGLVSTFQFTLPVREL